MNKSNKFSLSTSNSGVEFSDHGAGGIHMGPSKVIIQNVDFDIYGFSFDVIGEFFQLTDFDSGWAQNQFDVTVTTIGPGQYHILGEMNNPPYEYVDPHCTNNFTLFWNAAGPTTISNNYFYKYIKKHKNKKNMFQIFEYIFSAYWN